MKAPVFVDTSGFYALADGDDAHHYDFLEIVEKIQTEKIPIITSNYIIAETHVLILSRLGHNQARIWLQNFNFPITQVALDDQIAAQNIIIHHSDKDYSFTDATLFCLMRRLGIQTVFTFDHHFKQFGYEFI
ncbi:PIN domain-containing protein [bacterium]|nr:PIN domain-containing protein [bacterium]